MAYHALRGRYGAAPPRYGPAPKVADPFYLSGEWRALASACKRRAGWRCEECGVQARGRGLIADHIVEIKDGGARLDPSNVRALCARCHQVKTAKARIVR